MNKIINSSDIKLKIAVDNWQDAVKECGRVLVDNGYVEESYVDAMISTVKELGPYIVIAPGLAMPHARSADGVIKSGLSLITLEKPINFGNEDNDPVRVVVGLAGSSDDVHIKLLQSIVNVFEDETAVAKISEEYSVDEIVELFERKQL